MSPPVPVLELEGVTKEYPGSPPVRALRAVSLTVGAGELVAIVGSSGSGKSTLLHIIGTLERPTTGRVRVAGVDTGEPDDRQLAALRARGIGFVFQQFFLAEHQTALENVADGLLYTGVAVTERRERAAAALQRVGLAHRATFRPTKLSGGERQRVGIARAIVGRPAIVLADEPTGNLDSTTAESIFELLEQLNSEGATIVVITHERQLADRLPRQIQMRDGQIVIDTGSGRPPTTIPAGPADRSEAPAFSCSHGHGWTLSNTDEESDELANGRRDEFPSNCREHPDG